jgi:acetylornithine deacetylase/succinyl-diaminopimelate desuccinylase-like protein
MQGERARSDDLAAVVLERLAPRAGELAALVEQLVAFQTENPPGRELGACGRALQAAMAELGFAAELIEFPAADGLEEPCVVRGSVGDGRPTVYFHGHFDVVPAQSVEQFRPRRANGRILGRGTADMKGGIACMLYGAAVAADLGLLRDGKIVCHLVCDEETGGAVGSAHLRRAGLLDEHALAMVTAEPTGGDVWHASRGAITMKVTLHGREAHVGQAHLGDNAFEKVIAVAGPLADLSRRVREAPTAFPVESEEGRGGMLVVGGAAGAGASFNVVPGSAWFSVDYRFNPEQELETEVARLTGAIEEAARAAGADASIDVLQRAPSAATDERHPAARALARCVAAVEAAEPRFLLCPGVLETRWYAQLGIPAFAYGPGRLDVSHGPGEYVDEQALLRCAAVYALFAGELLRPGGQDRPALP